MTNRNKLCDTILWHTDKLTMHYQNIHLPSFLASSDFWSTVGWQADVATLAPPVEEVSVPTEPAFGRQVFTCIISITRTNF